MKLLFFLLLFIILDFIVLSSQVVIPLTRKVKDLSIVKRAENGAVVSIGGSEAFAEFYATIQLGTPQTSFEVQLDTGFLKKYLFLSTFFFLFF